MFAFTDKSHKVGREEKSWWKIRIVVGQFQWVLGFMRCEWTVRDHPLLWISSPSSGVTWCRNLEHQVYG
jgi:hypothetical protein